MEMVFSLPSDLSIRDDARRQAVRACSIRHPALADVVAAQLVPNGIRVEYAEPRDATPVAIGAMPLDGDAALRVLAPMAAGLAHLHDAGLGHGGISLDNTWVRGDGSGVLLGWRPRAMVDQDVADMCDLALALLPPASVHADLAQPLVLGSDGDPQVRPSMARLAAAFDAALRRPPASPLARRIVPAERATAVEGSLPAERDTVGLLRAAAGRRPEREESMTGHARHAARRPVRWRWVATVAGAAVLAVVGVGAVRASDGPQTLPAEEASEEIPAPLSCPTERPTPPATPQATTSAAAKRPPAPRESRSRPSGRSR